MKVFQFLFQSLEYVKPLEVVSLIMMRLMHGWNRWKHQVLVIVDGIYQIRMKHQLSSKIPAIKGEAEAGAPFGRACADALKACSDMFGKFGFDSGIYSGGKYGMAKYGEGEKTIGIFSHSDVVPVCEEDWIYTKPFEPKVIDGTLIGRGVEDNKSGVMAALCAMRIIKECNIPVKSRIVTFIGAEEETGMSDIEACFSITFSFIE